MIDLHAHSFYSDGSASPQEIVDLAVQKGISMCALADHDCIDGVEEAVVAGNQAGILVLPAIEMDAECVQELHILGYGINIKDSSLQKELLRQRAEREMRNQKILQALAEIGIHPIIKRDERSELISRTHIAQGLVEGGYVTDLQDAFTRYLGPSGLVRIDRNRLVPAEIIQLIHKAGGIAVLAHPGLLKQNPQETIEQVIHVGLDGIEAYYPRHTLAQIVQFCDIADQNNLLVTTGSDYHGDFRKEAPFGIVAKIAYQDERIQHTEAVLRERYSIYAAQEKE